MDEKHIVIIDDWLETIPEDEMGKISLPEAWRAAVNATFDALIKEGYLTEDCRPDWTKVAYKLKAYSPQRIDNLSAEHFNSMIFNYPDLARTAAGLILGDWAYRNALVEEFVRKQMEGDMGEKNKKSSNTHD